FLIFHLRKFKIWDDGISRTHAELLRLFLARRPDVDEHIFDFDWFFALFRCQNMRWLGADDAGEIAFFRHNRHALGKHDLVPPAANRLAITTSVFTTPLHH